MNKDIKVSIIVPVYNCEKYLKKCLKSLIGQTLKDIEIICVNDGSDDKSLEILNTFAKGDSRIKVFSQENLGQATARNLGIEKACGEYLGFVDADDWTDKDYFEKLYNAAAQNNCNVACAGFRRHKKFSHSIKKKFKKAEMYYDINSIIEASNIPNHNYIWNKIYKRSVWQQHKINFPDGKYYEDMAILIKILFYMGNMVSVSDTYYNYRKNLNSTVANRTNPNLITSGKSKKVKEDFIWAKNELYKFAKEHNIELQKQPEGKKEYIKLFNITIFKIYYQKSVIKYKLLGFIPFLTRIKM